MAFQGNASGYYLAGAVPMTPTQDLTVMSWVYYDSTSETGRCFMMGRDGINGYGLGIGSNNDTTAGNEVLGVFDGVAWIDANTTAGTGWKHICFVDRGGIQYVYLNGDFIGSVDVAAAVAATQNTTVGAAFDTAAGSLLSSSNRVAFCKAWSRALGTAEVVAEMNSGFPVFYDRLAIFWNIERTDGVGTTSLQDFTQRFATTAGPVSSPQSADNPPVARC